MTATDTTTPAAHTPTFGSLARAELSRVFSRRFVRWSALVVLGLMVLVAVIQLTQSGRSTEEQVRAAVLACSEQGFTAGDDSAALTEPPAPGQPLPSTTECTVREAYNQGYFDDEPILRSFAGEGVLAVGLGIAALAFVLGCTLGGAEWAQRTIAALLFWEPRRVRVFLAKVLAVLVAVTVFMVAAQLVWAGIFVLLSTVSGYADVPWSSLDGEIATNLLRSYVLALTVAAVAFGLASLTRSTGAALGVGFVYFAIVEMFLRGLLGWTEPWLLTTNIGALLTPGGLELGNVDSADPEVIGSVRGGVVLVGYALVLCGVGLELFRRRDVT